MLRTEPVDLRGRRALAKSLEKEERHATDKLRSALQASNAAVAKLRAIGSELHDEAERVSERAKRDRARCDDVEAQTAYAKARSAELDRLSRRGAREELIKEKSAAEKRAKDAKAQQGKAEAERDAVRRRTAKDAAAAVDAEALGAALDAEALDARRLASACALARGADAARADRAAERCALQATRRRALAGPVATFSKRRQRNDLRRILQSWARAAHHDRAVRRLAARAFRVKCRRYLSAWRRVSITNALADVSRARRRRRRGLRALQAFARATKADRAAREQALLEKQKRDAVTRRRDAFAKWQAAARDRRLHAVARAWHRGRMRSLAPAADAHASPAAKEAVARAPVTLVALRVPPRTPRPAAPAPPPLVPPPESPPSADVVAFAARRQLARGLRTWRAVRLARATARKLDGALRERAARTSMVRAVQRWSRRATRWKRRRHAEALGPDRLLRLRARVSLRRWRQRAHDRARAMKRTEGCATIVKRAVMDRALARWCRAAARRCDEKEALLRVEAEALTALQRQRERELDACGPAPWADAERKAFAARAVLADASRDEQARRGVMETASQRHQAHRERIAAAETDRKAHAARFKRATDATDALTAVAACLASRDTLLKKAASQKRKTTEATIRTLESTCATLTSKASDAEKRARQAKVHASKRAVGDASSLQRAVAVASDLNRLLKEAEAKEQAAARDVEALDHAAQRLKGRLDAAQKAATDANQRNLDVRQRYCDTAELQAALATEKARTHRRLSTRVRAMAAVDDVLNVPAAARAELAAQLKRKRDRLLAAAARAAASSDSESTCTPGQFGAAFGNSGAPSPASTLSGAPSPASAGAPSPAASTGDATLTMSSSSGEDAAAVVGAVAVASAADGALTSAVGALSLGQRPRRGFLGGFRTEDAPSSAGSAAAADSSPGADDNSADALSAAGDEPAPSQDGSAAPSIE